MDALKEEHQEENVVPQIPVRTGYRTVNTDIMETFYGEALQTFPTGVDNEDGDSRQC